VVEQHQQSNEGVRVPGQSPRWRTCQQWYFSSSSLCLRRHFKVSFHSQGWTSLRNTRCTCCCRDRGNEQWFRREVVRFWRWWHGFLPGERCQNSFQIWSQPLVLHWCTLWGLWAEPGVRFWNGLWWGRFCYQLLSGKGVGQGFWFMYRKVPSSLWKWWKGVLLLGRTWGWINTWTRFSPGNKNFNFWSALVVHSAWLWFDFCAWLSTKSTKVYRLNNLLTFVILKLDQVDLKGNTFGLLAAHPLTPLLSLHHPDYTDPIFPNMTTTQALKHLFEAVNVDSQRVLQQAICYDRRFSWTVSVSWGYAVQVFPNHMLLPDVLKVQETFKQWKKGSMLAKTYTFNTRQLHNDPCKRPTVFFLDTVSSAMDGTISSYKKSFQNCSNDAVSPNKLEVIKVVSQKLDPDIKQVTNMKMFFNCKVFTVLVVPLGILLWEHELDIANSTRKLLCCIQLLAPRRHCCDVLPSTAKDKMEIGIRECKDQEMVYMHWQRLFFIRNIMWKSHVVDAWYEWR